MKPITNNALLGAGVLVTPEGALQGSALSASGYPPPLSPTLRVREKT
jgi:hypothetical protein